MIPAPVVVPLKNIVAGLALGDATPGGGRFLMLDQRGADNAHSEIRVVLNWGEELRTKMRQAKPASR